MSSQGLEGECEIEVDFVDEGDLEGRFKSCSKNPEHKDFLSLKTLQFKDLPEHHQTSWSLDFIYHVAQFTVRLVVNCISPDRPCDCGQENTSQDRQCKCLRGNVRQVGSGLVKGLAGPDQLTPDIRDSTKTYFILVTAAHVIFDTREAQKTEIEFFYDDPHDRSSERKAFGLRVLNTNWEADFSEVLCFTEDHVISETLNNRTFFRKKSNKIKWSYPKWWLSDSVSKECQTLSQDLAGHISHHHGTSKKVALGNIVSAEDQVISEKWNDLVFERKLLHNNYITLANKKKKIVLEQYETVSQDLVVHISHPHGTSKKVTFGNIVSADTGNGHYQLIYSLATCKGSSGGPVFVIPKDIYDRNNTFENLDSIYSVPHARHHGNELNSSSSWTVYFSDCNKMMDKPDSSVDDPTLDKQNRVRLSLLNIEDLPLESRSYYNLFYIKYLSEFTVGIHVLNDATFDSKNMASGFVIRLANNGDIRPDLEDTTKTYFIMVTAAHVISDTSQAKETEINFFCDDLQDMSSVRKAFGWRVLNSDKETNVSEVLCVTTDQVIRSMLEEYFFKQPWRKAPNLLSELTSTVKECLADSFLLSVVCRDSLTFTNKKREHNLLFEVCMCLNSAFERLVLLTLLKDIDSFASDIFLRIYDETFYSSYSVTSQSYVLDYVKFLDKYLREKPSLKEKLLSAFSNKNKEDLIECIQRTSQELYCEIMLGVKHKLTFQISHHGRKEISFDNSCVTDEVSGKNRWDSHDDSPVFTTLCTVLSKDDTDEAKMSGISLRLQQYCFDLSNKTLQTDDVTTISFPRYDTGPIHPIGF
ncbi:unnamed protein product [Lymnaea stagnalis]|uniref:Peptidase S1 domain-containing protein n=1 Tax=Lymnaea stagnalis TaxID=6523 RepID=A0AAV2IAC1_LYMST